MGGLGDLRKFLDGLGDLDLLGHSFLKWPMLPHWKQLLFSLKEGSIFFGCLSKWCWPWSCCFCICSSSFWRRLSSCSRVIYVAVLMRCAVSISSSSFASSTSSAQDTRLDLSHLVASLSRPMVAL